ncbi:MAG: transglutaminase family protein [Rhodobacteraceae bacterium]|nr:transglutaminase family protein [Paracoccaceae bacterium]
MRLKIEHETVYTFATPINYGLQQVRKTPKSVRFQNVLHWETLVEGGVKEVSFEDHHRNVVELLSFVPGTFSLSVTSRGEVELSNDSGIVGPHIGSTPLWLYQRETPRTQAKAGVRALLRDIGAGADLTGLHDLSAGIRDRIAFEVGASDPGWSAEDAVEAGRGVCQDHTHVFIACARRLGVPARYVSGYLMLDQQTAQDAMHAWAEAYIDGLGWVGFDVANGQSPDTRYVRVATGLDYTEAAPVSGLYAGGSAESLTVRIDVAQQ